MRRLSEYLCSACVLLTEEALCGLVIYIFTLMIPTDLSTGGFLCWAACLLLLYLICYILTETGISINIYLLINALGIAGASVLTVYFFHFGEGSAFYAGCTVFCLIISGIHGAYMAYSSPGSNLILHYVDALIITLACYIFVVYLSRLEADPVILILSAVCAAADLRAVNRLRTESGASSVIYGTGSGGTLLLLAVIAGSLALTALLVGAVSGQVHSLVDFLIYLYELATRFLGFIWETIRPAVEAVLLFFFSLFHGSSRILADNTSSEEGGVSLSSDSSLAIPQWILPLIIILLFAGFGIWILWQIRGVRLQRRKNTLTRHRVVRKSHFLEALRETAARIISAVSFRYRYLVNRKTPQGLEILAERLMKRRKIRREKTESPGAFMRRLSDLKTRDDAVGSGQSESAAGDLTVLAEMLDRIYYNGENISVSAEEYRTYVRILKSLRKTPAGGRGAHPASPAAAES